MRNHFPRCIATHNFVLFLLLVALVAVHPVAGLKQRNSLPKMPPRAMDRISDSTVLGELKETIRKQAKEIESLREQLKGTIAKPPPKRHAPGGHGPAVETSVDELSHYLQDPFYSISLKRVGWLGLFLCSLSITALIMTNFEHTLAKQIELAYFVPMLAGHGGNTGGQTVGTVLSALSSGIVTAKDAPRVIMKEALTGVMSGIILGSVVSPIAHYVMGISLHVATVLFFTMPLVSTVAATLGSAIPFICVFLGLDPSVIAAPAMTSFVDVSGLMSYFLIANYIFGLFGLEL